MVVPAVPVFAGYLPDPIVAAAGLLLITSGLLIVTTLHEQPYLAAAAATAAVPALLLLGVSLYPPLVVLLAFPITWLASVWVGAPRDAGLDVVGIVAPPNRYPIDIVIGFKPAIALLLLGVASAVAIHAVHRRRTSALEGLAFGGPSAVLMALAALRLPWPTVAFAVLLMGLALAVAAGFTTLGPWRRTVVGTQGVVYVVSGLLGCLATRWSTVLALVLIVAGAALVGALGPGPARGSRAGCSRCCSRRSPPSSAGSPSAGPRTWSRSPSSASPSWRSWSAPRLRSRRRRESSAIEATAHFVVLIALALTADWVHPAELVCVGWALAVLARAGWPGRVPVRPAVPACYSGGVVGARRRGWCWPRTASPVTETLHPAGWPRWPALAGWACRRRWPRVRLRRAMVPAAVLLLVPTLLDAANVDELGDLVRWLAPAAASRPRPCSAWVC